jgi:hypothetical protein
MRLVEAATLTGFEILAQSSIEVVDAMDVKYFNLNSGIEPNRTHEIAEAIWW